LQPTKGKDEALAEMAQSIARLGKASKQVVNAAKQSPEELGQALKVCLYFGCVCLFIWSFIYFISLGFFSLFAFTVLFNY
jgi:hypothetical protein